MCISELVGSTASSSKRKSETATHSSKRVKNVDATTEVSTLSIKKSSTILPAVCIICQKNTRWSKNPVKCDMFLIFTVNFIKFLQKTWVNNIKQF